MRFTICNMTAEFGGLNGIFEADEIVAAWLLRRRRGYNDSALYFNADADAPYVGVYPIELTSLAPQVAKPFSPDNVFDVTELVGQSLDGAFIGACTTTEEELAIGALVLEAAMEAGATPTPVESGRRIVVPGDLFIRKNLEQHGLWAIYERAGFTVDPPGCSMCLGIASRKAGKGETWLSSQNRNFENRMGEGSLAWLASAATVAASALDLRLTDPRALLEHVDRDRLATILQRNDPRPMPEIMVSEPATVITTPTHKATEESAAARALTGAVQRFGDSVDTDAIIPGEFCHLTSNEALGEKAFYYVRPEFRKRAHDGGTIIVAGEGWGSGSSREMAVWALQGAGIQAIIARSYAFIHKRNLVNEALPFFIIHDPRFFDLAEEGTELAIELDSGVVRHVASGQTFQADRVTSMVRALQAEGGLIRAVQHHGAGVFSELT
jgi:homoaconitate hydratase